MNTCQCGCAQPTRGGKFLPGHDAKLKSELRRRAAQGDALANSELINRGWDTKKVSTPRTSAPVQRKPKETPTRANGNDGWVTWKCPKCDIRLTTCIPVSENPICTKMHFRPGVRMEPVQ